MSGFRRPGFVVTVSALGAACGGGTSEPTEPTTTATVSVTSTPLGSATTAGTSEPVSSAPVVLNGKADGRTVFRAPDGTCHVYASHEEPLPPGKLATPTTVECPKHMLLPGWQQCSNGTVWADASRTTCECRHFGNPPPPPQKMDCPSSIPTGPIDYDALSTYEALNARDPKGRTIYASRGGCYVTVPPATPPTSMQPPETEKVPCPRAMVGPAWQQCEHGELKAAADGSRCMCAPVFGNPPPVPKWTGCPRD